MYRVYIIQSILKASEWPLNPTMTYNVGSIVDYHGENPRSFEISTTDFM